jgi:hypothetical protein
VGSWVGVVGSFAEGENRWHGWRIRLKRQEPGVPPFGGSILPKLQLCDPRREFATRVKGDRPEGAADNSVIQPSSTPSSSSLQPSIVVDQAPGPTARRPLGGHVRPDPVTGRGCPEVAGRSRAVGALRGIAERGGADLTGERFRAGSTPPPRRIGPGRSVWRAEMW